MTTCLLHGFLGDVDDDAEEDHDVDDNAEEDEDDHDHDGDVYYEVLGVPVLWVY